MGAGRGQLPEAGEGNQRCWQGSLWSGVSAHSLKGAQAGSGIARGLDSQQGAVLAFIFHCLDLSQNL